MLLKIRFKPGLYRDDLVEVYKTVQVCYIFKNSVKYGFEDKLFEEYRKDQIEYMEIDGREIISNK